MTSHLVLFVAYKLVFSHSLIVKRKTEVVVFLLRNDDRAVRLGEYIVENDSTVRSAAKYFGISKSTVHKDLSQRLPQYNRTLYLQVRKVLDENKAQRHIRGGLATKNKYAKR